MRHSIPAITSPSNVKPGIKLAACVDTAYSKMAGGASSPRVPLAVPRARLSARMPGVCDCRPGFET